MSASVQVLDWVKAQALAGNSVGKGECWDLAEEALKQANAKTSVEQTPNFGPNADYVWGTSVTLGEVKPGDIIQLRNYKWTKTTTVTTEKSDGSSSESENFESQDRPHHTAVVVAVGADGAIEVIEQNVANNRTAHRNSMRLKSFTSPETKEETKTGSTTTVKKTKVTETVSGTIKVYRPIAK